jgi:hypothetical protein
MVWIRWIDEEQAVAHYHRYYERLMRGPSNLSLAERGMIAVTCPRGFPFGDTYDAIAGS